MDKYSIDQGMNQLKEKLDLTSEIWGDLDSTLLLLAFLHPSGKSLFNVEVLNEMKLKYAYTDYEMFEFLGDSILELITRNALYQSIIGTPGEFTHIKQVLVSNDSLYCLMNRKDLCIDIIQDKQKRNQRDVCADVFEALIGVLYQHLVNKGYNFEALNYIQDWLIDYWNFDTLIKNIITQHTTGCGTVTRTSLKASKTLLKELYDKLKWKLEFQVLDISEYPELFLVGVYGFIISPQGKRWAIIAEGSGPKRKQAEEEAAKNALLLFPSNTSELKRIQNTGLIIKNEI